LTSKCRLGCAKAENEKKQTLWDFWTESWGPFLTSPLGVSFVPWGWTLSPGGELLCLSLHSSEQLIMFTPGGELCPLGVNFSVCPSILLNCRECSPLGVNEGVNIPPRGQISTLRAKFTPGG
jgi:hypothetical protein